MKGNTPFHRVVEMAALIKAAFALPSLVEQQQALTGLEYVSRGKGKNGGGGRLWWPRSRSRHTPTMNGGTAAKPLRYKDMKPHTHHRENERRRRQIAAGRLSPVVSV